MSNSLRPHESQHTSPLCPSQTPGVCSNSCPLSRWCHPAISSSVVPFSSCPQPLPASGSFPKSQLFAWGGQSIGVSASASVLPMNTQDWSPLGWTGWLDWAQYVVRSLDQPDSQLDQSTDTLAWINDCYLNPQNLGAVSYEVLSWWSLTVTPESILLLWNCLNYLMLNTLFHLYNRKNIDQNLQSRHRNYKN